MQAANDSDSSLDDEFDDEVAGLPPLDGADGDEAPQASELGLSEDFADEDEDGNAGNDDLSVGLADEEGDDFGLGREVEDGDLADTEDAGDLIGGLDVPELAEDDDLGDDAEGLEGAEADLDAVEDLPPLQDDDEDGLSDALAADAEALDELPALDGQEDGGEEGFSGDDMLLEGLRPASDSTVEVAPGVAWRLLPFVEICAVSAPAAPAGLPVLATLGTDVLLYQGRLHRLSEEDAWEVFGGEGLFGRQVALSAAVGNSHVLWALGSGRVQCSEDGGRTFAGPLAIGEGQPMRGATASDGSLLVVCAGALYRCPAGGFTATRVDVPDAVEDVAVDGLAVLVATADGRLLRSSHLGEAFHPFSRLDQVPQRMQLRDRAVLVSTAEGLMLYDGQDCREAFAAVSHAFDLCFEPGGVAVYAGARSESGWLLVKIPVSGVSRRPAVVAKLPQALGAPRQLCTRADGDGVSVVVGFESSFLHVQVSGEQD